MNEIQWHKQAAGQYFGTIDGKRIATARKEGTSWTGTVVGLGFSFGGRRLVDCKELAQRHVERLYGDDEYVLFPVRDLKPGHILARQTWKDGDREIVSVDVDTEALTVAVELTSESARELGFTLDDTYVIDTMCRVRKDSLPTEPEEIEEEQEQAPEEQAEEPLCGLRRLGWERPGPGARRLPCILSTGHTQPHRDAFGKSFVRAEGDVTEGKETAPVASPTEGLPSIVEGGVTVSLPMIEAMAEAFVKAHPDWHSMTPVEVTEALGCWTGKPNEPSREELEREVHAAERHLIDLRRDYAHGLYRGEHGEERYRQDVESAKRVLRSFLAEPDAIKPE
ncbi:hypothetical protein [Streptomyces atroolivaceus]|uniref:hypothetical protein n=1 Tax=Streptomyces atroolivaceus TaxID=66869 RepID=UPI003425378D